MSSAVVEVPSIEKKARAKKIVKQPKPVEAKDRKRTSTSDTSSISTSSHPSVYKMVTEAVENLHNTSGSSVRAIKKYMASTHSVDVEKLVARIRRALKKAVDKKVLVQTSGQGANGSFKMASSDAAAKKSVPKKSKTKKVATTAAASKKTTKSAAAPAKKASTKAEKPTASSKSEVTKKVAKVEKESTKKVEKPKPAPPKHEDKPAETKEVVKPKKKAVSKVILPKTFKSAPTKTAEKSKKASPKKK